MGDLRRRGDLVGDARNRCGQTLLQTGEMAYLRKKRAMDWDRPQYGYEVGVKNFNRFQRLEEESNGHDPGNENPSAETTEDIAGGLEVETTVGNELTSPQPLIRRYMKQQTRVQQLLVHLISRFSYLLFLEIHGDRAGYDDLAIVTGLGTINGRTYMFIGNCNGDAIAKNLESMFVLKVRIVTVIIGEGGPGGALAIACPSKVLMLEHAVFYVASPEACAAILFKTAKAAPKVVK
ncbi:hypothetical protein OROHE_026847 [Orobanche hederae]